MTLGKSVKEIVEESSNPLLSKHNSWERVELNLVAVILNGYAFESRKFSKSKGFPLIRIRDVGKNITDCLFDGEFDPLYKVSKGDLLVGMDGDFNSAVWKGKGALLNQRVCKIKINQQFYDSKFLEIALPAYLKEINNNTSSVTVKHLSSKSVGEIPLPLPPLNEQHRIVGKVEELFSFLDAGVASLRTVQAQLKRYRQAVLKYAFEGKLTQQWRTTHQEDDKVAEKTNVGNPQGLPLLPDDWKWIKLNELGYFTGGGTPSTENPKFWNGHILWISPKDMKSDFISNSELKITNYAVENSSVNLIPKNSVLIVARSGILKRTLPVGINTEECTVNQDIKVLVPYTKEMSKFIRIMLKGFESNILNNLVKEGTTVHSLKYREFENQLFPIPPINEQKKIVEDVEKYLSTIDKTENAVIQNLIIAEKSRQSILKQAFMGKLVSQDPVDEPAKKLLDSIRAERLTNNLRNNNVELSLYVN